ncbi:MAG: NAD(+) diphosphatase [Blautia sp.]|nr:NAD(+) diphosphatase [Blautia sp.]
MIQDIHPFKLHNEYRPGTMPSPDSIALHFSGGKLLCNITDQTLSFPRFKELAKPPHQAVYIFSLDDCLDHQDFFLILDRKSLTEGISSDAPLNTYLYRTLKELREQSMGPRQLVFAAFTASHLFHWYDTNRFCGSCGTATTHAYDERAVDCPACKRRFYPRIQPAVIVGVTNKDRLLITRYANRPLAMPALVAGFTEIGETLEETVAREVMEEAGLKVKNIRYYKSQPWGIADDILAGFYCDVDGDDTIHMDASELKEAVWVPREEITGQPDDFSLTNEMMMRFRAGKKC